MVEHRVARQIERVLGADGLNLEQWRVIDLLSDGEGHPMTEIAAHAMVPAPTLTKIVDRLIASALVYRRPDEIDRRRVLVFLSDHGRDMHDRLAPEVARAETEIADELGGSEYAHLVEMLERLAG
jgi:Transcriptional regulators